jgi:hypothetical protein
MTEPVNLWKPVTDAYKEQAELSATAEAENQQKLREVQEANQRKPWTQAKAPLGIRIFAGYYFLRAVACALLLFLVGTFPNSAVSTMLSDGISNYIHLRAREMRREARRHRIGNEAQANHAHDDSNMEDESVIRQQNMHRVLVAYLLIGMVLDAVVGFLWWNRIRFIRWLTLLDCGALVVRALFTLMGHSASGLGAGSSPIEVPLLLLSAGINGAIVLYLAFGYGVKKWFQPPLYH